VTFASVCFLVGSVSPACFGQLDINLTAFVTETPDGLFKYEYVLESFPGSAVAVNTFLLDVGKNADITSITEPEGWGNDFAPDEISFQMLWLSSETPFDIPPGSAGTFSFLSPLEPGERDYFVANLDDMGEDNGNLAFGLIEGPSTPRQLVGDCNGDGVVNVEDANCACGSEEFTLDDVLSAAKLLAGDADGNGAVDFTDFVILSNNFGKDGMYTDGDFDCSGDVAFADFTILANNYGLSPVIGQAAGAVSASAVPEPATLWGLLLGVMCLLDRLRRRA
jgi:hypothetical protein